VSNANEPAIAANRFGLGARPGELAHIGSEARGWLSAQLRGGPLQINDPQLRSSTEILGQAIDIRRQQKASRQARAGAVATAMENKPDAQAFDAVMKLGDLYRPIYLSEVTARTRTAVSTDRPFVERLVQFWTNHFTVSIDKHMVLGLAGSFEREAIRPFMLGSFANLLVAAESHQAMLLYLDNYLSVGPSSRAARLRERRNKDRPFGINENLAREILELHTLGVNGGYTQQDVTTFAQVISGWSISGYGPLSRGEAGDFVFRTELHEPGTKTLLGKKYSDEGFAQGEAVLRDIAVRPATARFIATKLARHFIADEPSERTISHIERAFVKSSGDLPTVYNALIESSEAWSQPLAKYKTPSDYVISTYRGLQLPTDAGRKVVGSFDVLGQRTYAPGSPAGWPDRSADWDGASALLKRIQWAEAVAQKMGSLRNAITLAPELLSDTLSSATRTAIGRAASPTQALTLLLTSPDFMRR
jgi:uncharacterized protein (DUF1800 family)